MDKYQGIFDQGFSGMLEDSTRKTMPDFLDKLAETEKDFKAEVIEAPNIPYEKDFSLSRANDLTSDNNRDASLTNRFTVEKDQRTAAQNQLKYIDDFAGKYVKEDKNFDQLYACLNDKYSKELVNKYLESKIRLAFDQYSYLGFENLEEKKANLLEQSKIDFKVKRSTVTDMLNKFSKLEFVTNKVTKEYHDLLGSKRPLYVAAKFLFLLSSIENDFYKNKEARITFQRDSDQKDLDLRDIDNNTKRNSSISKQNQNVSMMNDYKQGVYSKQSVAEICKKMAKTYGIEQVLLFQSKFRNDLERIEKFNSRQSFDTDFASASQQGFEIQPKAKIVTINSKAMLNYAFDLMTKGDNLEIVQSSLKKKFGLEATAQFLSENEDKLQKHYGQLGYLFIDSNIYSNCDKMADTFSNLQHAGSKLVYSLKANSRCETCSLHKEGSCGKVGLMVSNNPIVRSPRAAKRVFEKASLFVPNYYVEAYLKQINNEESNLSLVSKFALGIENILAEEKKNIGKKASLTEFNVAEGFVNAESYGVDLFTKESDSQIIDDVLKTSSKFKDTINGWNVEVVTGTSKGSDPSSTTSVKMNKGDDEIELFEIDLGPGIEIDVKKFPGEHPKSLKDKDLDKLLKSIKAPTFTEIMEAHNKHQENVANDPMGMSF
jgi:hypothetical protein